jgi:non-specific serine/threonine protein kinase
MPERRLAEPGLHVSGGDAGSLLDPQAKAEYRRRLTELEGELEEAEVWGDPERTARAKEELDFLTRELAGAVGLGGRDRKAASAAEHARINVTKAIRSALTRIRKNSPALGLHLDRTIRTGAFCSYIPDPRSAVPWQL